MDQQQIRGIADSFINHLHQVEDGDPAAISNIVDMFADDAELSNPIVKENGGSRKGRNGIEQFWREYKGVFQDIHSEFTDITASDHSAGLFWCSRGTNAAGEPIEYEGVSLLSFDDQGKIKQFKGYFDTSQTRMRANGM